MKSEDKSNISNHLNEYDFKKLKIKFLDKDEIKIFSTLCQDGIFSIDEIIYNNSDKILIATFSRFCWELVAKKITNSYFRKMIKSNFVLSALIRKTQIRLLDSNRQSNELANEMSNLLDQFDSNNPPKKNVLEERMKKIRTKINQIKNTIDD